jgi:hypothetical protein
MWIILTYKCEGKIITVYFLLLLAGESVPDSHIMDLNWIFEYNN